MSKKLTPTRGLHRVQAKHRLLGLATKVTGRNLAAISYIISLEAERRGIQLELRTTFGDDGSLKDIKVFEGNDTFGIPLVPGEFLVLDPDEDVSIVMSADEYNQLYRRIVE